MITEAVQMDPIVRSFGPFTWQGRIWAEANPANTYLQIADATVPQHIADEADYILLRIFTDYTVLGCATGDFVEIDSHFTFGHDEMSPGNTLSYFYESGRNQDTDLGFGMPSHTPWEETLDVGFPADGEFGICPAGAHGERNLCTEFTAFFDFRQLYDTVVWRPNTSAPIPYDTVGTFPTDNQGPQPNYKAQLSFYDSGDAFPNPGAGECTCIPGSPDFTLLPDAVTAPVADSFEALLPNDVQTIWVRVVSVGSGIAWRNCALTIIPYKIVTLDAQIGEGAGGVRRRRRIVGSGSLPLP